MATERYTALKIFRGSMERLEQRYAEGRGGTLKDLAIAVAADIERAGRFMFDSTYPHFVDDPRKGGAAIVTPGVLIRMRENFVNPRGGQNG